MSYFFSVPPDEIVNMPIDAFLDQHSQSERSFDHFGDVKKVFGVNGRAETHFDGSG